MAINNLVKFDHTAKFDWMSLLSDFLSCLCCPNLEVYPYQNFKLAVVLLGISYFLFQS